MINVTKTFLPPRDEFEKYVDTIWKNNQLTNGGPLLAEFEQKAKEYLCVENFHFVTNGTMALQLAIKSLNLNPGEIITTPFSYVATTSAILWEGHTPVFVDIDPDTLCIDPKKIEQAITKETRAILAVHVFGNPCNTEAIEKIAKDNMLKVIYDGAHAFGVKYKNKPLLGYGDISICSFHSTKLMHTIEGGAIITKDNELSKKIELMRRFGHNDDNHIMLGINAKASEFQAAMGLCLLKYIDQIIERRKTISELYDSLIAGKYKLKKLVDKQSNYSYYPIIFDTEKELIRALNKLNKTDIFPRRYFYPSLNTLPYLEVQYDCPISEDIAPRIMCLPLYDSLGEEDVSKISKIINAK